ncbi:MAG: NADH-quinone oxidoreductase subunit L [Xanthomonadaceae bacterium]|nr:NADH-quinone oxidoreductase subunit L [Xanthomonadaceae bacterium]MDP2186222.1 NADH-quinone oxidoreductase subunit L [Xanthomonadales bacterium]MDZ4117012.1 NADH-quinone oxidoreductase subunit L [Xanthomonadaceae bacterium]MDZ4378551.1 NADH-quinone oxidoreductase subunit L [Xanthomonadaceae bacterium]
MISQNVLLLIALAPLFGAIIAGLFGRQVGRAGAHTITILGVALSFVLSAKVLFDLWQGGAAPFNANLYTWFEVGGYSAHIGFMVDRLSAMMMVVVTFVSLLVHVYTVGYMAEDPGYQRFFSYISLFTFSMLMLVMSNNFLQLFFGWEAVGLVSYLLIGFWFKKPSAIFANLKAFLVNRVGDFGFLLGIAGVLMWFGTLDYANVFANATGIEGQLVEVWPGVVWSVPTVIAICLFIGAMGKSAQVPLHVWLPDSMEGPTPISALIHAATMVTAGIFMVARMSPLFELSETALSFVLFIGATTAFFTGLIGIVQNDIKRVVAYSTLSQLGYMTVALGVSAYSGAVYHLMTHAFFKALLFLGAGSVIIALHHEQDMRKMGGLRRYMPITWITMWIGTLALTGLPFLSGFYSKDSIIEAAHHAAEHGGWIQQYGYWSVLLGVFVTSFYSFRLLYLTFHGKERFREVDAHDAHDHHPVEPKESPWVVTVPLVLLAIPSLLVGFFTAGPMLFGDFFEGSIYVKAAHDTIAAVGEEFHGAAAFALHGLMAPAFWLAFSGFALATYIYLFNPGLAARAREVFSLPYRVLDNKYGFDTLWINGFAAGGLRLGRGLWKGGDQAVIDGVAVNGSAWLVDRIAGLVRHVQSGYLYHYAFAMILGLIFMLAALIRVQG